MDVNNFERVLAGGHPGGTPGPPTGLDSFTEMFSTPMQSYFFYGGEIELKFDPEAWVYYLVNPENGSLEAQNGITSILKIVDKSDALVPWASKRNYEKIINLVPKFETDFGLVIPQMLFFEFNELALIAKAAHKESLDDAANVGKQAHRFLEEYVVASEQTQTKMMAERCKDPRANHCVDSALAWFKAHNVRHVETERRIYSRKYKYAGTLDAVIRIDSCTDPLCCPTPFKDKLSLLDYKTSNHLYLTYLWQGAAYKYAYTEEFGTEIEDIYILRLGKSEGDFQVWWAAHDTFEQDFAGFLACLTLSNLVDAVEERMRTQKRDAKAQAKAERERAAQLEKEAKAAAREAKKLAKQSTKKNKAEAKVETKEEPALFDIPTES